MRFTETPLKGAFVIELEEKHDDRGFFARSFCTREMADHGLRPEVVQCNVSFNHRAGTLRGMHYQVAPATETKLIRCTRGAIYDVIVDLRPESPTYLQHFGIELTDENRAMLYVPEMFAHGYQALTDGAEVVYQVSQAYTPGCERGLRHDDPALGIRWPAPVTVMSDKDRSWPLLEAGATATTGVAR
jgi:dTDP-4-dehydrorhamnose 3,5-epimerase